MTLFLFILLILMLLLGWPLLRGWLAIRNLRQRLEETFGGHASPNSSNTNKSGRTTSEDTQEDAEVEYTEMGERKIFTSTEGEYVDYEEVVGAHIEPSADSNNYESTEFIEQQVMDVEFEEIT